MKIYDCSEKSERNVSLKNLRLKSKEWKIKKIHDYVD